MASTFPALGFAPITDALSVLTVGYQNATVTSIVVTNTSPTAREVHLTLKSKDYTLPIGPWPVTLASGSSMVLDQEMILTSGDEIHIWADLLFAVTYVIYGHV